MRGTDKMRTENLVARARAAAPCLLLLAGASAAGAEAPARPPLASLIDAPFIESLRGLVRSETVTIALQAQRADLGQTDIAALDAQWRKEVGQARQPLIARVMASPASTYLRSVQAGTLGLIAEIMVFDRRGLNVAQGAITSDYWQGDEDKWSRTVAVGPDAVLVDEPEWDADFAIWRAQVDFSIADPAGGPPLGGAAIEINLTELERRRAAGL
jgi:hypothetical protein